MGGIIDSWEPVFDTIYTDSHTGDTNWQTCIDSTGKGKLRIGYWCDQVNGLNLKFTVDGNVLTNGVPQGRYDPDAMTFYVIEWNISIKVEYKCVAGGNNAGVEILYYNL